MKEREKDLRLFETNIKAEWDLVIKSLVNESAKRECEIIGLPFTPKNTIRIGVIQNIHSKK